MGCIAGWTGSRLFRLARNRELIRYFQGRKIWLLEPDQQPLRLVKYPGTP